MVMVWLAPVVVQVVTNAPAGTSGGGAVPVTSMSRRRQWPPPLSNSRPPGAVTLTVWVPGDGASLNDKVLPVMLNMSESWPSPMP